MPNPGTIGSLAPAGEDALIRRIEDIERKIRELAPSVAQSFQPVVKDLQTAVDHLNSLTTTSAVGASINSGTVPGDSTFHWMDDAPPLTLTLSAATGHVLLTIGCGQATVAPGNSSAIAAISVQGVGPAGWSYALETIDARLYSTSGFAVGAPLIVSAPIIVPSTGPVTFTVKLGVWSSSTTTLASAQFSSPYINGQVIN